MPEEKIVQYSDDQLAKMAEPVGKENYKLKNIATAKKLFGAGDQHLKQIRNIAKFTDRIGNQIRSLGGDGSDFKDASKHISLAAGSLEAGLSALIAQIEGDV